MFLSPVSTLSLECPFPSNISILPLTTLFIESPLYHYRMIETEDVRLSQERLEALKELINPIKDLAKNWNVDISIELEKFMSGFTASSAAPGLVVDEMAHSCHLKTWYIFSRHMYIFWALLSHVTNQLEL